MIRSKYFRQAGFTLIEMVVSIVVLGIAAAALMGVFTSAIKTSADPMIQQQAIAIAEAYMAEILRKDFADDMVNNIDSVGGSEPGESRQDFNDIRDYNNLPADGLVRKQDNTLIPELADYRVAVVVSGEAFGGISIRCAMRIDVTVTHDRLSSIDIRLSSFRTYYFGVDSSVSLCT